MPETTDHDYRSTPHPRKPRFDLTFNIGHVFVALSMLGGALMYWRASEMRAIVVEEQLKQLHVRQLKTESATEGLAANLNLLTLNVTKLQVLVELQTRKEGKP